VSCSLGTECPTHSLRHTLRMLAHEVECCGTKGGNSRLRLELRNTPSYASYCPPRMLTRNARPEVVALITGVFMVCSGCTRSYLIQRNADKVTLSPQYSSNAVRDCSSREVGSPWVLVGVREFFQIPNLR
jgi:hypothetical protein